jgi:hypothetical protein
MTDLLTRRDARLAMSPDDAGDTFDLPPVDPAADGPEAPVGAPASAAPLRWKSKGALTRRGFTIHAYVGANGHGKSLAMVHDTYPSIIAGRKILSTVRIIDPRTGETYWNYEPLREMHQLVHAHDCDVLLDEIVGALPSMPGQSLPVELQLLLNQLRRRDVCLRWTAPSWMRCNVVLREVTQAVTVCRGYSMTYTDDGSRQWGMNRVFRWTTYDAFEFTQWSDNTETKLKGKANTWIARECPWWMPGKVGSAAIAAASYDTFDAVDNIDSGEGYCFRCGGMRPKLIRPACEC